MAFVRQIHRLANDAIGPFVDVGNDPCSILDHLKIHHVAHGHRVGGSVPLQPQLSFGTARHHVPGRGQHIVPRPRGAQHAACTHAVKALNCASRPPSAFTIPSGSASVFTVAFITTSTFSDNNDGVFPKIPIIFDFLVLNIGSRKISSGVFPLFDKKITGSPNSCIPKSPCTASDG